jgi:glycosyltransferase involved in cell wall biosynthesis
MVDYPRTLIVGHGFNSTSGGGITLTNLFNGWDRDKIAVATGQTDFVDATICEHYYHFGSLEDYWVFPFSLIPRHAKMSQAITVSADTSPTPASISVSKDPEETWLRERFYGVVHFLGVEDLLRRLQLSPQFLKWVADFKPQVIYTLLGSLNPIRLVTQLADVTNAAVAIHMMDDWPSAIYQQGLFSPCMRWRMNAEFRALLEQASVLMGISPKMCRAFESRYRKPFLPFHNPIEPEPWRQVAKKDWLAGTPFRLVYAGRVGCANQVSLYDVCEAVAELNAAGRAVQLDLYIPEHSTEVARALGRPGCVFVNPPVPHQDIPALLTHADGLVLPLDFGLDSIRFARYSMPTKVTEYMISGVPVLVYAPADMAVVGYAGGEKWGYVVSERNKDALYQAMIRLMDDQTLREQLGRRAQALALQNHDAAHVREAFRQTLAEAAVRR